MGFAQPHQLKLAFDRLRFRLHRDGFAALVRLGLARLRGRRHQNAEGSAFDREFGTDTEGNVPLWQLEIDSPHQLEGAHYQTLAPFLIRRSIEALPADLEDFSFCDLGSGKGRILMIASEYPFKRVIGVEFSHELNAVAAENILKYPASRRVCQDVSTLQMDAIDYQFPSGNLLVFLFNPFGETVLRGVLANLESALLREERSVWIVYFNAVCARLIDESGLFSRVEISDTFVAFKHEPGIGTAMPAISESTPQDEP
ncbi:MULTISPECIES: class I SAM-dependent methyltransferase [Phyllobacteriaceae]|jgi:predicted RNA methylase|uniref:class I SAM-dependent methyltransferase n=1 Tax=Phyllobacteriaceae TaxID=69277 RepID=UPI00046454B1|nr:MULTISPECIES: class I SAM-dependent methyltransferase [Mesorhizobium]MBN9236118.1 class I SAM-dependent methyltransferase [Mesorhizobium sp.]MDQ0328080.1 putative RNA methylase [Mesorhizobium sp. YL-MeA3-2017]